MDLLVFLIFFSLFFGIAIHVLNFFSTIFRAKQKFFAIVLMAVPRQMVPYAF